MEINGNAWKSMRMHGNQWECMEIHENASKSMRMHGNPWECMGIHGNAWGSMRMHRNPWESMEIHGKFQQALKMAENREKRRFTFFAFLPPYISVSSFPTYPNRLILTRSIDCYQKFFISCPVARYWKI